MSLFTRIGPVRAIAAAFGLILCALPSTSTTRADEPLQSTLSDERLEARLNDRLTLTAQGKTTQQKDLQLAKAPPPAPRPSIEVRARSEGAALREQKTKRVAAAQN